MIADDEGFLYPEADAEKCIQCGKCLTVCPLINDCDRSAPKQVFAGQIKDEQIRGESTSGGVFTAIALPVIRQKGIVFGAALDNRLHCRHIGVETEAGLAAFRGSKYVQSDLEEGSVYRKIRELLDAGREVLFSGTPCQVAGLRTVLGRDYGKLLCVDVVCHSAPSPLVWEKYLVLRLGTESNREGFRVCFRDKTRYGYEYSTLSFFDTVKKETMWSEGLDTDPYMRAFFTDLSIRPSCVSCPYRGVERAGDITLWDCFHIENYPNAKRMDNNSGVTHVAANTEKGIYALSQLEDADLEPINKEIALESMRVSVRNKAERRMFLLQIAQQQQPEAFDRFFPQTLLTRAERLARRGAHRLGCYRAAKEAFIKLTKFKR